MKNNLRQLTTMALLIAINVILTRFLAIQTPIVRIGFTFLPIVISAILYGPWMAGVGAAIADVIGMMVFPTGAYFPGFTLTAFLTGLVFGFAFYKKEIGWGRIIIANLIVCLALNLGLDTVWLLIITGKGFAALLVPRIIKCAIMIPVQVLVTSAVVNKHTLSFLGQVKNN